ncbi:MAG TPA: bifunctional methylenetetrahydrofolate dehydrogenase/methenyltetrahydrofolate cyclohydrolase FolD [Clostridiales bacterium]|nr:bifunctional methylenetetrahydrofolate dehydrogenase/methenyltetrahydrofolate cyclohydrolase FolD [Clostridiales bacterium]HCG35525.1 bifunctional methylenetetrahydrofolate dehydrogenase/methenyltetrahydrofolate cyclohydrolase FolD [Clostridiales bacterium]
MAMIMDGKATAQRIRNEIKDAVEQRKAKGLAVPGLAVILVGEDPASQVYVRNKQKACEEVGFYSEKHTLSAQTTKEELLSLIKTLNNQENIHGILVQLPLPQESGLSEEDVIQTISPDKDVDAFGYGNVGKIMVGNASFLPCTPAGVMELLKTYGIDPAGKEAVVVGRSNIVGKPQALLLLAANATVTIAHSKTKNLADVTRRADILVAAVGKEKLITGDMVKEGAVVMDVGMNRGEDGKLCGDVDFDAVSLKASYMTPVPGGVGPMTIAMLLKNTLVAAVKVDEKK